MRRISLENLNKCPADYVARVMARGTVQDGYLVANDPPRALPSIATMAISAVSAVASEAKAVMQGVPDLSPEEVEARLALCRVCEFYRDDDGRCSKCGCFMEIKTVLRTSKCPVGTW